MTTAAPGQETVRTEAFDYHQVVAEKVRTTDDNLLVIASMSSGKTNVAVDALDYFKSGAIVATTRTVCYQHYRTLCEEFTRSEVAIGTGDYAMSVKVFQKTPYCVLTMFKLLQLAINVRDFANHCPVLVLDEIDDMSPYYQLAVTLIRSLHPSVRIVGLTGTMHEEDVEPVAEWLGAKVVKSDIRPTDLHFHIARFRYNDGYTEVVVDDEEKLRIPGKLSDPEDTSREIYRLIREGDNASVLFFSQGRAVANRIGEEIASWTKEQGVEPDSVLLTAAGEIDTRSRAGRALSESLPYGVGVHHGGLLSPALRLVEELGQESLQAISACFTLVRGVNFPFGHVVLSDLFYTPYGASAPQLIPTSVFQQVAARAGRVQFGKDGHVWIPVFSDLEETLVQRALIEKKASRLRRDLGTAKRFATTVLGLIYRGLSRKRELSSFLAKSLWASEVGREGMNEILEPALGHIRDSGLREGEPRFLLENRGQFSLTEDGKLAARLALHPVEFDLLEFFIDGNMEFQELLELLAGIFQELDDVDVGEDWQLVAEHGLGIYHAAAPQHVKDFADYVQRMLTQAESFLRIRGWDNDDLDAWRTSVYRPYVCGQMPVATALFDVIPRKTLERLIRHSGRLMQSKLQSLTERDLRVIARLIFGTQVEPKESRITSTARALRVDRNLWQEVINSTRDRKEVV